MSQGSKGLLKHCRTLAPLMLVAASVPAWAQQPRDRSEHAIELYVSEDAVQALYTRQMNTEELGTVDVRAGVFYSEDRDLIAILDGLSLVGGADVDRREVAQAGSNRQQAQTPNRQQDRFELRVGPRAYGAFLNAENEDIFGIALGAEARYWMGADRSTSVVLGAFYAPDIATFGQADNIADLSLDIETELRPGTDVYVGFRAFEIDVASGDREVDDNMHVGFRRRF